MNFKILRITTSGIKCLEKPFTVDFENNTYSRKVFQKPSLKVVYGLNGAGKTSFIASVHYYCEICKNVAFIVKNNSVLKKIINKKTNLFSFEVYFVCDEADGIIFKHKIEIDTNDNPYIKNENFSISTGRTLSDDFKLVLSRKQLIDFSDLKGVSTLDEKIREIFEGFLKRLPSDRSILSILFEPDFVNEIRKIVNPNESQPTLKINTNNNVFSLTFFLIKFINSIQVSLSSEDKYNEVSLEEMYNFINEKFRMSKSPDSEYIVSDETIVPTKKIKLFRKQITLTTKFVKLFKPELKEIKIFEEKTDDDFYKCRLMFQYNNYEVDYKYESTGLKNIVSIFSCLYNAAHGGISFIDEIDANLNEVYLECLFKYFLENTKGELCATIHNTSPMKIFGRSKYKHTLDFINNEQECIPWIKNGSSNPVKMYKEGMIYKIPFNIESYDFVEVFGANT